VIRTTETAARSARRSGRSGAALFALAAALVAVGAGAAQGSAAWRTIPLSGYAAKTAMMVEGRQTTYHRFDAGQPLSFKVVGPVRLKVLTRLVIPNPRERDSYTLVVARDGVQADAKTFDTVPADKAFYVALDSVRPGVIRRLYIDVPTGEHAYEIRAEGLARVDARVFASTEGEVERVGLAPRDDARPEVLVSGDRELTYYLLADGNPITLDVVGPTTVTVNVRLMFDDAMQKRESFVVTVEEQGGEEVLTRIETARSETVRCRDRGDVLPGALRQFTLDVAEGRHTYRFRLAEAASDLAAVSFHIPRGDVANAP
jgi:hypothetical protein